jgi:maltose O-acetyltransferase
MSSNLMKTEFQKMVSEEIYNPRDPEICAARDRAHEICAQLNKTSDTDRPARQALVQKLFNAPTNAWIESPFLCDYGVNTTLGNNVYFNFDCLILDTAPVRIGNNVMFAPGVHIYTATHPIDADKRRNLIEFGKSVEIGDDVWIGGRTVICPGVKIGARTVIGAGSVVTKDIPADVVAAGNPCRVIRKIEKKTSST